VPALPARIARVLALSVLFATTAAAQAVPVRDLPKPSREIEDPFSMVTGAIEIKPGQLLAIDGVEMVLTKVDFANGSKTAIGRQGSGPGEYRVLAGLFRLGGDTIWVLDAGQQRIVAFNPDMTPGTTIPMIMFDQSNMTVTSAPFFSDRKGQLYASAMAISVGRGGASGNDAQISLPDSVGLVKFDPRGKIPRAEMGRVRFPVSGKPDIKVNGTAMKYTMAFPGLVASDPWTVFPDGRIAIVRGATYTVEFIAPDGKKSTPVRVAYDPIKVTPADQKAEMDEARRSMQEQAKAAQKMLPAGVTMDFELTPPASWPGTYPAVAPLGALAGPDGRLWVKRSTPIRVGREQWDVIDQSGKLVASWRLPAKTTLVAVGQGVVYTARTDEDDLRYVQRVEVR
jgi:hypothetical protein